MGVVSQNHYVSFRQGVTLLPWPTEHYYSLRLHAQLVNLHSKLGSGLGILLARHLLL